MSPTSARAPTRNRNHSSSCPISSGIIKKILLFSVVGGLAFVYKVIQPPPPKICGSVGGPPITAPRIKLRDGRHLAYEEYGVAREKAKHKIVHVHGINSCRHDAFVATTLSQELFEVLGLYIVSFDRPGYGESDPDFKSTDKSIALDIEELADQLELGSKFYVIGFPLGGEIVWTCLKYIPHRLAGAALLAPVVNFWWNGLPANLTKEVYSQQLPQDQWAYRVSHYAPWLTYWWNTQKWFPISSVLAQTLDVLSSHDIQLIQARPSRTEYVAQVRQQGEYVSVHRDLNFVFGTWNFNPTDLKDPFPDTKGSVHIWQGEEDLLVPATLQRYIIQQLGWVNYHELPGRGHMFPLQDGIGDTIIKTLLLGEN